MSPWKLILRMKDEERKVESLASIVEKGLKYVIQKDYLQSKSDWIWATLTTNVKAMGMDTCILYKIVMSRHFHYSYCIRDVKKKVKNDTHIAVTQYRFATMTVLLQQNRHSFNWLGHIKITRVRADDQIGYRSYLKVTHDSFISRPAK